MGEVNRWVISIKMTSIREKLSCLDNIMIDFNNITKSALLQGENIFLVRHVFVLKMPWLRTPKSTIILSEVILDAF